MKKEGIESSTFSDLEKSITITTCCGGVSKTLHCLGTLEDIPDLKTDHPYGPDKDSGTTRADVINAFETSMRELIDSCKRHVDSGAVDKKIISDLVEIDENDSFLGFLNHKRFDGIYEDTETPFRRAQYQLIKDNYSADRKSVGSFIYANYLECKKQDNPLAEEETPVKKGRGWKFYGVLTWAGAVTVLCAASAVSDIASYFQVSDIRKETKQEIKTTKDEIRATVSNLEKKLTPKNIIDTFEEWSKTEEGQEYMHKKYEEVKALWIKEGLIAQEFDRYWRNTGMEILEERYKLKKLMRLADDLERFRKMFPK